MMKPKPLERTMAIERVAVIGAGTMGAGIAQVCAQAGWTTALYDAFPEGLERGMQRIDAFWDKGIGAVMVTDTANFRNPNYHTQSDTPETLSADFLAGTTEYVWRTVSRLIAVSATP